MNLQVNEAHSGVLSTWRRAGTLAWFFPRGVGVGGVTDERESPGEKFDR